MASKQTIRRFVMTGSIAGITATGVWYGAGVKIQKDYKQEVQKIREATPGEKIAQLEQSRGPLVAKRLGLEKKIHQLEMRAAGATWEESIAGRGRERKG